MKFLFGWLALGLNLAATIPYVRGILRKTIKPHAYSWCIWAILTNVICINQIQNHGGWSVLFSISGAFFVTLIFLLSLKYGIGGAARLDKLCLLLALLLLTYWLGVHDTRLSTVLVVMIDAIGSIPTLLKTYRRPDTETYTPWFLSLAATVAALLAVPRLDWVLMLYPAYVFLLDSAIILAKYIGQKNENA